MSLPLLQTKLNVPPLRAQLVPRPQLLMRLHDQAVAWLSRDEADNDPARFLT